MSARGSLSYSERGSRSSRLRSMNARSLAAMRAAVVACMNARKATATAVTTPRISAGPIAPASPPLPPVSVAIAVYPRARITVYQWHTQVHQQYGKRDSVRIASPGADYVSEEADTGGIDHPAARGCRGRNRVRRDEEGAEHGGTSKDMETG